MTYFKSKPADCTMPETVSTTQGMLGSEQPSRVIVSIKDSGEVIDIFYKNYPDECIEYVCPCGCRQWRKV